MVLYALAALGGIGFGLLQARWTAGMAPSGDQKGRTVLLLAAKLALWAAVMVALALFDPICLLIFALSAGAAMILSSIILWRKSRDTADDHHTGGHQA